MTYKLRFHKLALKEWEKLDPVSKNFFKKKLKERLEEPHVPSARLRSLSNCYKIKLATLGYRLVYQVEDNIVYITVIAIGKRDKNQVYQKTKARMN